MNVSIQNSNNPRKIIDAVITDENWDILVVDKIKEGGRILTILPWWKLEEWETKYDCLIREIKEEIWITLTNKDIWYFLWETTDNSPSSNISSNVKLYQIKTKILLGDITLEKQLKNARYLSSSDILKTDTVTKLTQNSILQLLNTQSIDIIIKWLKHNIKIAHNNQDYIYLFNDDIYIFPIKQLKFKKTDKFSSEKNVTACYIEELEFINWKWNDKNSAFYNFISNFIVYLSENNIDWKQFIKRLVP